MGYWKLETDHLKKTVDEKCHGFGASLVAQSVGALCS